MCGGRNEPVQAHTVSFDACEDECVEYAGSCCITPVDRVHFQKQESQNCQVHVKIRAPETHWI